MDALQPIADAWAKRTPRERALAMAVAGLLAVFAVLLGFRGALRTIDRLDAEIGRMQSDIVNYTYQIARRQAVEARYEEVAAQHSSAWSESEIRDRLRQEIYRLRYRKPPRVDANGIPVSTESEGDALVRIPELRGGQLLEGGEGYREFQIEFEVEPAPFPDMLAYLEYLQGSPQSLRIDRLDMRRDPQRPEVDARILLTRTVVDDPSGGVAAPPASGDTLALRPEDWTCEGCEADLADPGTGEVVLRVSGAEADGRVFLTRMLPASAVYDVQLEVAARLPASLGVNVEGPARPEAVSVPAGDTYHRCHFRFRVPDGPGERVSVGLPALTWSGPGNTVKLRNLRIVQVEGGGDGA